MCLSVRVASSSDAISGLKIVLPHGGAFSLLAQVAAIMGHLGVRRGLFAPGRLLGPHWGQLGASWEPAWSQLGAMLGAVFGLFVSEAACKANPRLQAFLPYWDGKTNQPKKRI